MDELTPERCREILATSRVAHLGVIDGDRPYVSPLSYVLLDDRFCFRSGAGRRMDAMRANPVVCIEVSVADDDGWESVIAWGEAREVTDDGEAQNVISALLSKYRDVLGSPLSPGSVFPEPAIVVSVPLDLVSGRTSGHYFSVRTRPGRL